MIAEIAVIGCGSIGMRHVEALGRSRRPMRVYAVDMDAAAGQRAKALFDAAKREVPESLAEVVVLDAIDDLPAHLNLVIVATTAQRRIEAIAAVLRERRVEAMILEKFLFPRREDYARAADLLHDLGGRVWVNCTRRVYPAYREIADRLRNAAFIDMTVSCSATVAPIGAIAIHFADLLAFLGGSLAGAGLTTTVESIASLPTRRGVDDFSGSLEVCSRDGRLRLRYAAQTETAAPLNICIDSDLGRWVIQEWCQSAYVADPGSGWRFEPRPFTVPYQSRLTDRLAEDILDEGRCGLPTFAESANIHLGLLAPLLESYRTLTRNPQAEAVPFT